MVTRRWKQFTLIVVFLVTQGCGTVFNGTVQKVSINSLPPQATYHILKTERQGTTPATVELKRKESHTIVVEKDGYEPKGLTVERRISWIIILDAIAWPTVFLDFATGGAYEFNQSQLLFELKKRSGGDTPTEPFSVNATGTWRGSYNSSVYGSQTMTLNIQQSGAALTGTFSSSTGSLGQISGSVSGNTATVIITITTPGCSGSFDVTGIINTQPNSDTMSFHYNGSGACGSPAIQESGTGNLTKQ